MLTVSQELHRWFVLENGEIIGGPFKTNREAWRCLDKIQGDPHNRKESAHDWYANKKMRDE